MFNEKSKKKYKTIFAFEVLEHLYNPQDGIKQIKDLLDEDGIFIGTSPFPFKKNVLADKTHRFCLHPENWKKFFLENGFKKVEIYPMSFIPFVWRINKHLNIRLPFYISIKHFISTTLIIAKK